MSHDTPLEREHVRLHQDGAHTARFHFRKLPCPRSGKIARFNRPRLLSLGLLEVSRVCRQASDNCNPQRVIQRECEQTGTVCVLGGREARAPLGQYSADRDCECIYRAYYSFLDVTIDISNCIDSPVPSGCEQKIKFLLHVEAEEVLELNNSDHWLDLFVTIEEETKHKNKEKDKVQEKSNDLQ
ncbi:hypothetical protein evm_015430 [Chilo suppressalis]|nr:hypothetical protein evm_015430 [Chilo suppressalis]